MKKISFYLLLFLTINNALNAQLDQKLWKQAQDLYELQIALAQETPKPTPIKPKEEPKPAPKQLTWAEFIEENNNRKRKAAQNQYPDFGGTIQVSIDGQYQTLEPLQQILSNENKACVNFYPGKQMHMTLLYLFFPIEPSQSTDEFTLAGDLNTYLANVTKSFISTLKPLVFNFEKIEIIGKEKNFLVATYNPVQKKSDFQNKFILQLGTTIFKDYPHAWFDFIENLTFHVSLGKLKDDCSQENINIPAKLPQVKPLELKKGTLRVSIKRPTAAPYFIKIPGW